MSFAGSARWRRSRSRRWLRGGLLLCIALLPSPSRAQIAPSLHRISFGNDVQTIQRSTTGLFTVVALRAEFVPDTTRFTTGDGTFAGDPYSGLAPRLDPLPHDADFFRAHLDALEHYVQTVSDGQAHTQVILLPEIVRVSRDMAAYSPLGPNTSSDAELGKLAGLVAEAWAAASETQADLSMVDPQRTFFVLFHAGVGRDIELVGTTLDKTPLDLPSIYFGPSTLDRMGIRGLTTNGVAVTNTAIIPRTETRRGFDFVSDTHFLTDLTTNGLLAASFLNFLGVPDLFDTVTGTSAIGPFGLMDPLGIFAYRGLIPPEPSAWTKLLLGWTNAVEVREIADAEVVLQAVSSPQSSDVARVWISETEYFLVENRHRDIEGDGLVLSVFRDGVVSEQRISNGDETFNQMTVEGFDGGVVIRADDYDWSLPGGLDEAGNDLLGGILVWHIDEAVIAGGLPANTVNVDQRRRGVDLEEADSGQDLGFPSQGLLGPALDVGTPFDFFFEGNPVRAITASGQTVRLYRNRFGPDTYPSSETNAGGPSFVVIEGFSPTGPTMSFRTFREAVAGVETLAGFPIHLGEILGDDVRTGRNAGLRRCPASAEDILVVPYSVTSSKQAGVVLVHDQGRVVVAPDGFQDKGVTCFNDRVWGIAAGDLYAAVGIDPAEGLETDRIEIPAATDDFAPVSSLMAIGGGLTIVLSKGDATMVATLDVENGTVLARELAGGAVSASFAGGASIAVTWPDRVAVHEVSSGDETFRWELSGTGAQAAGRTVFGRDREGLLGATLSTTGGLVLLGSDGGVRVVAPPNANYNWIPDSSPILSDLDADGRLDVVVAGESTMVAFSQGGAVINGFPIEAPGSFVGQPLVSTSGEGFPIVVAASGNGNLYGYDVRTGSRIITGFPLAAGAAIRSTPLMDGDTLYAVSSSGDVRAWKFTDLSEGPWSQQGGSSADLNYVALSGHSDPPDMSELLIESETYNWPNPVREGATRFRVLVTEDGTVDIDIVDIAGGHVDRIEPVAVRTGVPHEFVWSVSLESGLYFARVVARSASGRQGSKLIKVAVIR